MKCAIFEEHSSSCVVYFRFSGTLFPVSMIDGVHAKNKKIKFLSEMRARIQTIPKGGGGRIASRGRFVPVFLLGNKWHFMIFMRRSGPLPPSVSAHIRVSNSLDSHFIFYFLLGLVNSHGSAVAQW